MWKEIVNPSRITQTEGLMSVLKNHNLEKDDRDT